MHDIVMLPSPRLHCGVLCPRSPRGQCCCHQKRRTSKHLQVFTRAISGPTDGGSTAAGTCLSGLSIYTQAK